MTSPELDRLVESGSLKRAAPSALELSVLLHSGRARLTDAGNALLSLESQFDLAYNAAFALSLFALRRLGYRPNNRYIVFQCLTHTAQISPAVWRVLDKAHSTRNFHEYEGGGDVDVRLLNDLLLATAAVNSALSTIISIGESLSSER